MKTPNLISIDTVLNNDYNIHLYEREAILAKRCADYAHEADTFSELAEQSKNMVTLPMEKTLFISKKLMNRKNCKIFISPMTHNTRHHS